MNQSFSFKRISILIGLDFSQKWKQYVWVGSLLIGCVLLTQLPPLFYEAYNNIWQLIQYAAIPLVLLFGSSFYTSTALSDYTGGQKGIFALMIPASTGEKTLCSLLVNLVFVIPFLLSFWLLHYQTTLMANERISVGVNRYSAVSREVAIYASYCYFLIHSAVFVGSIYFAKLAYVKTLTYLLVGALAISILNTAYAKFLADYPLMLGAIPFAGWSVVRDSSLTVYRVSAADLTYPWPYILPLVVVLGFFVVSYKRLQEKQI
ncbi:hypothetical protein [Spirosoma fluviale]|uniref:ABC-2 family transporter protein n=1 Tax=Spirosoma fluviale TaxID=1597977 RepID=A0A286G9T1_9BACT|nr:hypothetical protein [Spirosoma fluviale]SOD92270.1 hypothetical protein SAMN06269250_3891 [Spirosoma fluviale]